MWFSVLGPQFLFIYSFFSEGTLKTADYVNFRGDWKPEEQITNTFRSLWKKGKNLNLIPQEADTESTMYFLYCWFK